MKYQITWQTGEKEIIEGNSFDDAIFKSGKDPYHDISGMKYYRRIEEKKMRNNLTVENHLELSKKLSVIVHDLREVIDIIHSHCNTTSKLYKLSCKIDPHNIRSLFADFKSCLDDDWCRVMTEEDKNKYGFIYYTLDKIYEELKKNDNTRTNQE